jgi:hypothetical protein
MRVIIIMRCTTEKAFLRYYTLAPDFNSGNGIKPHIIANGRIIIDFDTPGIMQPDPGPKNNPASNLATKESHQPTAEPIKGDRRITE